MKNIITLKNIEKKYFIGLENEFNALSNVSFEIKEGELVAIVGASGSGKTTLMNILGALDRQTSGQYYLDGVDVSQLNDKELSNIRNKKIGFVFQTFNLISRINAIKNIEMPMLYAGKKYRLREEKAKELLKIVDMSDRMYHYPNELSGGQKQRVAIARAMANDPSIILADEPTGALDSNTGKMIMEIFKKLNKEQNKTVIIITHSMELAYETDRIITISDGKIISDKKNKIKLPKKKEVSS